LSASIKCLGGTYTDLDGQSVCKKCLAGTFCPTAGLTTPTTCPAGSYCLDGSIAPTLCNFGNAYEAAFCPWTGMGRDDILKTNWGTWPTNYNTCQSDKRTVDCDYYASRPDERMFLGNYKYPTRNDLQPRTSAPIW
jgi:hypothetical protein